MTCVQLRESLAETEDGRTREQRDHLRSCAACSALLTDLLLIASTAVELRSSDEPSVRVWNSIEATLRKEGVIRPQRSSRSLLPSFSSQWSWARWLAPAAAALLVSAGLYIQQHAAPKPLAGVNTPVATTSDVAIAGLNDDDLLQEVAQLSPAVKAEYEDNLRRVNQYIQDAKGVVAADPNDDEARRSLMEAYQQKAMLFELAMDRSLP